MKKIFMLAAMLLMSVGAFAQNNEPLEGDVNNDGTVDVADIVGILKIMKDGGGAVGEKMCYWYSGTNNGNVVTADNFTDVASRIPESEFPETGSVTANGQYVYFVMPEYYHLESLVDGNGSAVEFTCTDVMGYHIYKTASEISGMLNYTIEQIIYYFSIGTTPITADNYTTANNATTIIPTTINYTSTERNYHYILIPSNKTITVSASGGIILITEQTSISIPNHKVYRTNGALSVGGTITITLS
jgi:hypothetical protein